MQRWPGVPTASRTPSHETGVPPATHNVRSPSADAGNQAQTPATKGPYP